MKVLILCSKKYWDEKMSRCRFHYMEAIKDHPDIEGIFDGPGFDGFTTALQSVKRHAPDAIFWYKPTEIPEYDKISKNILKVISYNEMHTDPKTEIEIRKSDSRLVVCHLENEIKHFSHMNGFTFVPVSHCIKDTIFKDYGNEKENDLLITGFVDRSIYPLRYRFLNLVKANAFSKYKVKVLPHPGYQLKKDQLDKQLINYANEINKSKIVFSCSSRYKFALAKYFEIPACNSLIAADIPDERPDFFNSFVLYIDPKWNNAKIVSTVSHWLDNNNERETLTKFGRELIVSGYNQRTYADNFYNIVDSHLSNRKNH